jgi:hypothetical protein
MGQGVQLNLIMKVPSSGMSEKIRQRIDSAEENGIGVSFQTAELRDIIGAIDGSTGTVAVPADMLAGFLSRYVTCVENNGSRVISLTPGEAELFALPFATKTPDAEITTFPAPIASQPQEQTFAQSA